MIIQKVIKGIGGIDSTTVNQILQSGIICRWWQEVDLLPQVEIPKRLSDRNLTWHQNRYNDPDPEEGNQQYHLHTPFISTTAGTVERDSFSRTNMVNPAWLQALRFATNNWTSDGYLFYCYLFILGKKSVGHQYFSEEVRELNIYTGYSPFQPEGEITAKIIIPSPQIEKVELWSIDDIMDDLDRGRVPSPISTKWNDLFLPPDEYSNVRELLE